MIKYYNEDYIGDVILSGGTEQRNLPEGYTQVEYLQSDGSCYIDLLRVPNNNDIIEQKFQMTSNSSGTFSWYGSMPTSNQITPRIGIGCYNGRFFCGINHTIDLGIINTNVHTLRFQATGQIEITYTFDGTTATGSTTTDTDTPVIQLSSYLFARHGDNGVQVYDGNGTKIFYHKEYLADNTLAMNLIPCRRNSDNVLGMYDTVSGQFLTNQGTGTFTAGDDVVPTPDAPMDIVCNNGVVKVRHQSGLPLDYTLLEYIESTGTQYIDTGLVFNSNYTYKFKYQRTSNFNKPFAGFRTSDAAVVGQNCTFTYASSNDSLYYAAFDSSSRGVSLDASDNNVHEIIFCPKDSKLLKDNISFWSSAFLTSQIISTQNFYIFNDNRPSMTTGFTGNFFSYQVLDGNTLIQNLIPCRRKSDNVLGMYDTITRTFFTNAGTGEFIAGDPVDDIEIYADGTVETINVHGKNLFDAQNVEIEQNKAISGADGSLIANAGVNTCASYIKVSPNTTYTISGDRLGKPDGSGNVYYFRLATYDINKQFLERSTDSETVVDKYTFTTGANVEYIRFHYVKAGNIDTFQLEQGSTATEYEPYFNGGTATAEMLLKVGDYVDTQKVIGGKVTRNVGVLVLDGTEEGWTKLSGVNYVSLPKTTISNMVSGTNATCLSNNFVQVPHSSISLSEECFSVGASYVNFKKAGDPTVAQFKQYLADQYANGTPVIVVYPLATPTTEQVDSQFLDGKFVEQISGAISNLPIDISHIHDLKKRYVTDSNGNATEITKIYKGNTLLWER